MILGGERFSATSRLTVLLLLASACAGTPPHFELIIKNGMVYDGTGAEPARADVAINADTIAAVGNLTSATSDRTLDAAGLAVAPGFINTLSWADGSLLRDGRSMSDIMQGVTLEVFGEGLSAGPRKRKKNDTLWTTLGGYFEVLRQRGVTPNFASLVGATTVRQYVLSDANRAPSASELAQMKALVAEAMQKGALGLGASLIYAPADYASTSELAELSAEAARFGGIYMSHLRSESDHIYAGLAESFTIAAQAKIAVGIYHLKINHARNWHKIDTVLHKIDSAQKAGLSVFANMYPYTASGTGLLARLPTWVQEGGPGAMRKRLRQPAVRRKVLREMAEGIPTKNSDPEDVLVLGFRKDSLNARYKGMRLSAIAKAHGKNADETVIDLLLADQSSIASLYFLMSDQNMKRMLQLPFVSICSDGASEASEPPFTNTPTHPRVYGSFARVLGPLVRDERLFSLTEAVRKMTSLPAQQLNIKKRGALKTGNYADVAIFAPHEISDKATFDNPHQYAVGMKYVFVNGVLVLAHGQHTGKFPGQCVRGPGWRAEK
jgi:N-acyl-D-amino-acid deacylase